jgi:hypothetical protein
MRCTGFALVMLLAVPVVCSAGTYVVPTTTLSAQTANNTSAANNFATQSNGNRGVGNVSKVDLHSLLYAGATTKVYAHLMLWFGRSNHMNVGYSSADAAQVKRQIHDMISRGINGVIIDWYGPNNFIDQATRAVMTEAENHPGFTFAIMVDQGAIQWDSCSGCTPQQALIQQLEYVESNYFPSRAYMTEQGRPVVTNFNLDLSYSIDWNAVSAALSSNPAFLFQNNIGFSHVLTDGSYSWVMPTTTDYGIGYLASFYNAGMSFPGAETVGAAYKGFNDSLASWGSNRIMKQQCGQTWLQTFKEINSVYNAGKQLPYLQLVTWNDYEEGTEIESGIDNCVSVAASVAGKALQWTISGSESTVDHYVTYISSDGQNLMPLTEAIAGVRSINLCNFPIPQGQYKMFVQAVGRPGLTNQMTGAVSYTPACGASSLSFEASPSSLTIPAGKSASLSVVATPQSGSFNNPISLSCTGLPKALDCSFSPATITPGSGAATSRLTIAAVRVAGGNLNPGGRNQFYATTLLSFGIVGLALAGSVRRRRIRAAVQDLRFLALSCAILGCSLLTVSCGGGGPVSNNSGGAPSSYSITVHGNSNSLQVSTTVNVIVQ